MAEKTLKFLLVGEDKSASKALKGVGDSAEKASSKLGRIGEVAAGVLTADLLKNAASAVIDFGKASIEAYRDAAKSQRELEDAFKRFPNLANAATSAQDDFARATANVATKQTSANEAALKVQIAEQKLNELRKSGKASASALMVAEDKVRKARDDLAVSTAQLTDATDAQREAQDALANPMQVTIDQLRELNQAIQDKTGADADDLASSQAVLAQYGLTGKQLMDLTPLLDDYALKTGRELPDAAEVLGKAMLGNGKALKEIGIDFEDTGSVAGNFDQIMEGLRKQVGGFAEQEAGTAEGKLRKLKTEFGDVQETVGEKLLPVMLALGDVLLDIIDWVQENEEVFEGLGKVLVWLWNEILAPTIKYLLEGLASLIDAVGMAVYGLGKLTGDDGMMGAGLSMREFAAGLDGMASKIGPITLAAEEAATKQAALASTIRDAASASGIGADKADALAAETASILAASDGSAEAQLRARDAFMQAATKAGFGASQAQALWEKLQNVSETNATPTVDDSSIRDANSSAASLEARLRRLDGMEVASTVWVTQRTRGAGGGSGGGGGGSWGEADGGIVSFANGTENHIAQIARAGDWRVWAEPETGGEAYIPLSPAKRQRSLAIWQETGRRLGVQGMADGAVFSGSLPAAAPVVHVHVAGSVIRERDLAVSVRNEIAQLMRRRGLNPAVIGV